MGLFLVRTRCTAKHRQSSSTLTHKHVLYVLREIFKPLNSKCRISEIPQHEFYITGLFVLMTGPIIQIILVESPGRADKNRYLSALLSNELRFKLDDDNELHYIRFNVHYTTMNAAWIRTATPVGSKKRAPCCEICR